MWLRCFCTNKNTTLLQYLKIFLSKYLHLSERVIVLREHRRRMHRVMTRAIRDLIGDERLSTNAIFPHLISWQKLPAEQHPSRGRLWRGFYSFHLSVKHAPPPLRQLAGHDAEQGRYSSLWPLWFVSWRMPVLCACLIARKPVSAHVSLIPVERKRELLLCSGRGGGYRGGEKDKSNFLTI
jgi:hypothetical protein